MAKALLIEVKESAKELKHLSKRHTSTKQKHIQMLLLIKKGKRLSKDSLALALGVSGQSIQTWRTDYLKGGLELILQDQRGGFKQGLITPVIKAKLEKRLSNPTEGFTSYKQVQQWLKDTFSIEMKYQALYQFLQRNFKVKLKVARKNHIHKDPAAEAVFKNSA
jgi:transposase